MATLFKDLGKSANDLLNKGYIEQEKYNWKVELTNSSANGVKITPSVSKVQDQPLTGSVKTAIPLRNGFTSTLTYDLKSNLKLEINTDSYLRNSVKPSLEITTSSDKDLVNNLKFKQTVDVATSWGGATFGFTVPSTFSSPVYNASIVATRPCNSGSTAIGVESEFTSGNPIPLNLAASFITPAVTATFFTNFFVGKANSSKYGVSFYGPVASNPSTLIGSELQYDSEGKATQLSIGASHKYDSSSNIKARINSRGIFGFVFTKKINDFLSLSFLADLNVREANNPNSLKYGVKITI